MKNSIKTLLFTGLISFAVQGQQIQVKQADKQYDQYNYVDAIKVYEKVYEKGYKSPEMLKKLGNAYYFQAQLQKANIYYGDLFAQGQSVEPEYYYRYAQTLKSVKDYTKADAILVEFERRSNVDSRAKISSNSKNYLDEIRRNSGRYTLENAGINSKMHDFGSSFYNNKLVFATARDTGGITRGSHKWNGQVFTNLYQADRAEDGSVSNPSRFSKAINTKYHESTPVFTKDGNTMFFTRNNYIDGKKGKDSKQTILLKLYKSTYDGKNWGNVKELPFNSDQYSVAHPALSPDEKVLYFASDMPGTKGQADIWKVALTGDDSYGTPINLGDAINTEGKETFPFVTADNELYFATDGQPGLGGLDVYVAKTAGEYNFEKPRNVGEPINSSTDDFAFIIDTKTKSGFVTSNREGGLGSDDIYKFKENAPLPEALCEQKLSGIILDEVTKEPIPLAKISLLDNKMNLIKQLTADGAGKYDFGSVECSKTYYIRGEKEAYNTAETSVQTPNVSGETKAEVTPQKTKDLLSEGTDLATLLGIKMIYFDLDKSNIRPDAAVELAKILYVMKENPKMLVDVRSHTDCRQRFEYNMKLSDRRAKATIAWLVQNGVEANRLSGRGYGESQLKNNCACEPTNMSLCTEAEHQANRRSEFIIIRN